MLNNQPSIAQLFFSFLRLGLTAFGGPAMVAYIREMAVNRRKWLDEQTFKEGVVLCQSIPGAIAIQTAAYVGLRSRGIPGAFSSFVGFGLPAFVLMLILSSLYVSYHAVPRIVSLFNGLQVIVVAIVANATYSFGKSTFKGYKDVLLALAAAVLLGLGANPFLVIMGAAAAGIVFWRRKGNSPESAVMTVGRHYVKQLSLLFMVLFAGLLALYLTDSRLFKLAVLMMRIDLFAFGGGFASVPLMMHEVVDARGWLDSRTFMDGIALGQITPGPIVITSTFVGYLTHGIAGALVSTVAIFVPSLLMVIAFTPVIDRLKSSLFYQRGTKGILASFVGLLLFVTLKFAVAVPWDPIRALMACAAFFALLRKVDILYVVLVAAVISVFVL
ncbi:MAG TPA: chromate efflux transporter [Thermodesulfovibrionales bacterium]|nr:chromate efflux transporter [Thermodesulfovibrionales bacterium]